MCGWAPKMPVNITPRKRGLGLATMPWDSEFREFAGMTL